MKRVLSVSLVGAVTVVACSSQSSENPVLQASDLQAAGGTFDANEIVDLASFTDDQSITADAVHQFLGLTPYNRESFLSTYSSNGVLAIDAIMNSSTSYRLNPIVFLVAAEMDEGLIGDEDYPIADPASVEYVFGCGCANGRSDCDPALAGFDLQVDCLGRNLRASLDQIAAQGVTSGGWGPNVTRTTLDGVAVDPADASTATLYQYTPYVNVGKAGGNWLFWNLWQKYAGALEYFGGGQAAPSAWIGDPCTTTGTCAYPGGECATNYPGGLCTASCTGTCPSDPTEVAAFCADFQSQGGFCLPVCNPNASQCRTGYSCTQVAQFQNTAESAYACVPQGQ